jgi:hypothetical protein
MLRFLSRHWLEKKRFLKGSCYYYDMDDLEEEERGIDDLVFPRRKTLTDLWREEWGREFKKSKICNLRS